MNEKTHPAEKTAEVVNEGNDRRKFLTHTALGVAGAAGVLAVGANTTLAAESNKAAIKSRILERIKNNMSSSQFQPVEDGGGEGGGVYVKNSHSLYLK